MHHSRVGIIVGRYGGACFGVVVSASAVFPLQCPTPYKTKDFIFSVKCVKVSVNVSKVSVNVLNFQ